MAINPYEFGAPVDFERLFTHRGQPLVPLFGRDFFPQRSQNILSAYHLIALRRSCRHAYDNNSNIHGLISALRCFTVGAGYTLKVVPKSSTSDKRLAKQVQELLDDFIETNEVEDRYGEDFTRSHVDGETFVRLYPQTDGVTLCRFIEPDMILAPTSAMSDGIPEQAPWSYGILTENNDFETPIAYNITWPTNMEEYVVADMVIHSKLNVSRNIKRGLPSLLPCLSEADVAKKLRWAAGLGEAARQSIAYIRRYARADSATITALNATFTTDSVTVSGNEGTCTVPQERRLPGTVEDIPEGLDVENPPTSDSAVFEAVHKTVLQAVAARFQVPQWLVSGDADSSSYASAVVAESPFMKRLEYEQQRRTKYWRNVFAAVLDVAVDQGLVPPDVLKRVQLCVEAPSPLTRNGDKENAVYETLNRAGILSKHTWASYNGLDLAEEEERIATETPVEPEAGDGVTDEAETMGGKRQQDEEEAE